jgi:hypothetical protein
MQQYVIFNVLKEYCIPKEEDRVCDTMHVNNNNKRIFEYLHFRLTII